MKYFMMLFLFLILINLTYAAPPHPDLLKDTKFMERYNKEVINYFFEQRKKEAPKLAPSKQKFAPVTGTRKILILKIDFSNRIGNSSNVSSKFIASSDSLKDYYYKASYGKLNLDITEQDIYPSPTTWYRASNLYENYGNTYNEAGVEDLVKEAINLADNAGVNFANYDANNDGKVDHILILHSGNDEAMTGISSDIWSHQTEIATIIKDGKQINSYAIFAVSSPLGIICHEFGHDIGFVDLYSTSSGNSMVDNWDVMDYGLWINNGDNPCFPSIWHKILVGWLIPEIITTYKNNYQLGNSAENDTGIKIPISVADNPTLEYYLIENRQNKSYDAYIPGSGLLIWHIDDSVGSLNNNNVNINPNHLRVDLIEANNTNSGSTHGRFDDPWKNNVNGFGPYSIPPAKAYNNTLMPDTVISNIGPSADNMTFNIFSSNEPPIITILTTNYQDTIVNPVKIKWEINGNTQIVNTILISVSSKNNLNNYYASKTISETEVTIFTGENTITISALNSQTNVLTSKSLKIFYSQQIENKGNIKIYNLFSTSNICTDTKIYNQDFIKIDFTNDTEKNGVLINKPINDTTILGLENLINNRKNTLLINIDSAVANLNIFIGNKQISNKNGLREEIFEQSKNTAFELKIFNKDNGVQITNITTKFQIFFDSELFTGEKNNWKLFYFNEQNNRWENNDFEHTIADTCVYVSINHLTTFALFYSPNQITSFNNLIAYPNPYVANSTNYGGLGIYFFRDINNSNSLDGVDEYLFSGNEDIEIYTITGKKVLKSKIGNLPLNNNKYYWNLKDSDGSDVASGVYIIYISDSHSKYFTKAAVVR
ncbi:MAG TPA: M6 family metalloprotease domain-containing protein [bacterium]|nr:M6 family metalloprotease domain-containing protein [bacterium]